MGNCFRINGPGLPGIKVSEIKSQPSSSLLPPMWTNQVSTTLIISGLSIQLVLTPLQIPCPSCKKTGAVTIPSLDPATVQSDELLSIISLHSRVSDYSKTGDENLEEEGETEGDTDRSSGRQGTTDKPGLPCAWQKTHQGLLMQDDGFKGLIDIIEGTGVANPPALMPALWLITRTACSLPARAAKETMDSEKAQIPEEPEVPSTPVTTKQHLQLAEHK